MAPVTMTMMTMMTVTMMTVTVMAMMTVVATMLAAGGSRCDRSRAHGNGGDGSKSNFAKH